MYGLIAILCFVGLFAFFLVWQFYNLTFHGHDPFYVTNKKLALRMIEDFEIEGEYAGRKVYELGCGRAPFLHVFAKSHPKATCVGVENALIPYIFAKIQAALHGGRIKIVRNDLFHFDVSDADLIYCFLDRKTMVDLGRKLKFECKMGTGIISNKFPIPNMKSMKKITLEEGKVKKGHEGENKIFYYEV